MLKACKLATTQQVLALLPPLSVGWDGCGEAQIDEGVEIAPDWDLAAQPAPPITRSISASIGDGAKRRFCIAAR